MLQGWKEHVSHIPLIFYRKHRLIIIWLATSGGGQRGRCQFHTHTIFSSQAKACSQSLRNFIIHMLQFVSNKHLCDYFSLYLYFNVLKYSMSFQLQPVNYTLASCLAQWVIIIWITGLHKTPLVCEGWVLEPKKNKMKLIL